MLLQTLVAHPLPETPGESVFFCGLELLGNKHRACQVRVRETEHKGLVRVVDLGAGGIGNCRQEVIVICDLQSVHRGTIDLHAGAEGEPLDLGGNLVRSVAGCDQGLHQIDKQRFCHRIESGGRSVHIAYIDGTL